MSLFQFGAVTKKASMPVVQSVTLEEHSPSYGIEVMTLLAFKRYIEVNKPKGFWFLSANQDSHHERPDSLSVRYRDVCVSLNPPLVVLSGGKGNTMTFMEVVCVERDTAVCPPLTVFRVRCRWLQKPFQYVLVEDTERKLE